MKTNITIIILLISITLSGTLAFYFNSNYQSKKDTKWNSDLESTVLWMKPSNENLDYFEKSEKYTGYIKDYTFNPDTKESYIVLDLLNDSSNNTIKVDIPQKIVKDSIYIVNYDILVLENIIPQDITEDDILVNQVQNNAPEYGNREKISSAEFVELLQLDLLITIELGSSDIFSEDFPYIKQIFVITNYE